LGSLRIRKEGEENDKGRLERNREERVESRESVVGKAKAARVASCECRGS